MGDRAGEQGFQSFFLRGHCIPALLAWDAWLAPSAERVTLDPQRCEFEPHVGCRDYFKIKPLKKKKLPSISCLIPSQPENIQSAILPVPDSPACRTRTVVRGPSKAPCLLSPFPSLPPIPPEMASQA